jgi:hypothetical protein
MASGEGVTTLAGEMSHHDKKPVEMAGPNIGSKLARMIACTAVETRIRITLHATAMTKCKAPAAMAMI